jgi:hypothetical protein
MALAIFTAAHAIPAEDPRRRREHPRIFVDSLLAERCGDAILADPAYARLGEEVVETLLLEKELVDEVLRQAG